MQRPVMQRSPNSHLAPAPLYDSGRIAPTPSMDPNHFPSRLHDMLREINDSGNGLSKIVSWQPHGKCFLIKDKEEFIEKILPKWFCRLKPSTFERQLHKHGFRKLSRKGPDQGAYYHPKFLREMPEMAITIRHTNSKGKRGRKPKSKHSEPDFYNPDTKLPATSGDEEEEEVELPSQDEPGAEDFLKPRNSSIAGPSTTLRQDITGASTTLRQDQPKTPTFAAGAPGPNLPLPSSYGGQARGTQFLNEPNYTDDLQLPSRPAQSLLSPVLQQDSLRGSSSRSFQAQLEGYLQQQSQPIAPSAASLRTPQHAAALDSDEQVPVPVLGRQSSDFSMAGGLGLSFGMGDSPPDDVPAYASLDAYASASQSQQSMSLQLPYQEHQQRINDLIYRNQQQQRNLQLQQQQLEQQRLELQLRQQQQHDVAGRQALEQQLEQQRLELQLRQQQHQQQDLSGRHALGQRQLELQFRQQQQQDMSGRHTLGQRQLEQQRLELQLRQQQQQDLSGRQALGQSLGGASLHQQIPFAPSNYLLRDQQHLQQYQNQLNQQSLAFGLQQQQQQQQQQEHDQGQGNGQGGPYSSQQYRYYDP